jgi:hypothetical protein
LYEVDEGGQGLIMDLTDGSAWQKVARRALEILHVDPATGEEMSGACEKACYDCLLSYYNQQRHTYLDRRLVIDTLKRLAQTSAATLDFEHGSEQQSWADLSDRAIGAEGETGRAPPGVFVAARPARESAGSCCRLPAQRSAKLAPAGDPTIRRSCGRE